MVMVYSLSKLVPLAASWKYCGGWYQWWEAYLLWFWNDGKVPFFTQINRFLNSPLNCWILRIILHVILITPLTNLQHQSKYQGGSARSILWSLW